MELALVGGRFAREALEESGVTFSERGIETNLDCWKSGKAPLIERMRTSPDWKEDILAIVIDAKYVPTAEYWEKRNRRNILFKQISDVIDFKKDISPAVVSYLKNPWPYCEKLFATERIDEQGVKFIKEILEFEQVQVGMKYSRLLQKLMKSWDERLLENIWIKKNYDLWTELISEKTKDCKFVLSANPADYLLMSNGNSWCSCHNLQDGEYRAGCLSYMNDSVTLIAYTVESDTELQSIPFMGKINRQVVFAKPDDMIFVGSRVYPNDDDRSFDLFRDNCKKIFSGMFGVDNDWETYQNFRLSQWNHLHYPDYDYFEISSLLHSSLKEDEENYRFKVGNNAWCLNCGSDAIEIAEFLACNSCEGYCCMNCGCGLTYDEYATAYNGNRYCFDCSNQCEECSDTYPNSELQRACNHRGDEVEVCPDCLERLYFECGGCGEFYRRNCAHNTPHDEQLCLDCFEELYSYCSHCGALYQKDELHDGLCDGCLEENKTESADPEDERIPVSA